MRVRLAVVAKELFEPLLIRITFRPNVAQSPLAKSSTDVAFFLLYDSAIVKCSFLCVDF